MTDKSWMPYKAPFGKYKGATLAFIKMNDVGYIEWMAGQDPSSNAADEFVAKCKQVLAYINETGNR